MKIRHLFLIIFLNLFSCAYAANSSDELTQLLNGLHSMRAGFAQTVFDNKGKAIQKSSGRMSLERPGKFRWQVTQPIPQTIIANETRLWVYDPDLQQVTISKVAKVTGDAPALLLSQNNTSLDKDFTVKEIQKDKPNWRYFSLIPKKGDSMFMNIQIAFQKNNVSEMHLTDHLGHTTVIQFKDIETNVHFAASQFKFKAPAHVDVIDETQQKK